MLEGFGDPNLSWQPRLLRETPQCPADLIVAPFTLIERPR